MFTNCFVVLTVCKRWCFCHRGASAENFDNPNLVNRTMPYCGPGAFLTIARKPTKVLPPHILYLRHFFLTYALYHEIVINATYIFKNNKRVNCFSNIVLNQCVFFLIMLIKLIKGQVVMVFDAA